MFAKHAYGLNCTGGSNPPLSAGKRQIEKSGVFLWHNDDKKIWDENRRDGGFERRSPHEA
jgi:hypothetical protein